MRRRPFLTFFLLAFLFSWGFWIPMALASVGRIQPPFSLKQMQMLGAYGPALAALVVTLLGGGLDALRDLLARLFQWRAAVRWYLLALFLPATISFLNTALHTMFGGDAPNYAEPPIARVALPPIFAGLSPVGLVTPFFVHHLLFGTAIGEEIGWRGFALEKFQQRFSPLAASVLIAFVWVMWALPLSWASPVAVPLMWRVLLILLGAVPASILSTWIYNGTGRSLLLVVLFNNSIKVTDLFLAPPAASPLCTIISLWIVAVVALRLGRGREFAHQPVVQSAGEVRIPVGGVAAVKR